MSLDGPPLQLADVLTVIAGALAYAVFLVAAAVLRLGRGKAPTIPFNRAHLRLSSVYGLLALGALWVAGPPFGWRWAVDLAVGAFFYFGLHYAVFLHFFGLAITSVSASVLSIAYRRGGRATRGEIVAGYAGGEGFEFIKRSRLARLETFLRWVERPAGSECYRLTPAGLKAVRTMRFFLKTWSLSQLGGKP